MTSRFFCSVCGFPRNSGRDRNDEITCYVLVYESQVGQTKSCPIERCQGSTSSARTAQYLSNGFFSPFRTAFSGSQPGHWPAVKIRMDSWRRIDSTVPFHVIHWQLGKGLRQRVRLTICTSMYLDFEDRNPDTKRKTETL